MSLTTVMTEERRLRILQALEECERYEAGEGSLSAMLDHLRLYPTREIVRAELGYLAEHSLVQIERLPGERGEVWVARLTEAGQRVARGRSHPGIKRAEPR